MTIMAQDDRASKTHPGSSGDAVGISTDVQATLADLSALMQRAVARMQEKRTTVDRLVAEPTVEKDNAERPAPPRAVR